MAILASVHRKGNEGMHRKKEETGAGAAGSGRVTCIRSGINDPYGEEDRAGRIEATAKIIRQARLTQKLSQMEVANRADINLGQYQRLEYGVRDLSMSSMKVGLAVCYVLQLDPFLLVLHVPER